MCNKSVNRGQNRPDLGNYEPFASYQRFGEACRKLGSALLGAFAATKGFELLESYTRPDIAYHCEHCSARGKERNATVSNHSQKLVLCDGCYSIYCVDQQESVFDSLPSDDYSLIEMDIKKESDLNKSVSGLTDKALFNLLKVHLDSDDALTAKVIAEMEKRFLVGGVLTNESD